MDAFLEALRETVSDPLPAALVFAVLSLGAWIVLRRVVGVKEGQVKVGDKDING